MIAGKNKHALVSAKKPKRKPPSTEPQSISNSCTPTQNHPDRPEDEQLGAASTGSAAENNQDSIPQNPPADGSATLNSGIKGIRQWQPNTSYTRNDKVQHNNQIWICRRSLVGKEFSGKCGPGDEKGYRFWKVDDLFGGDYTGEDTE
jgi:hypothetical protein